MEKKYEMTEEEVNQVSGGHGSSQETTYADCPKCQARNVLFYRVSGSRGRCSKCQKISDI